MGVDRTQISRDATRSVTVPAAAAAATPSPARETALRGTTADLLAWCALASSLAPEGSELRAAIAPQLDAINVALARGGAPPLPGPTGADFSLPGSVDVATARVEGAADAASVQSAIAAARSWASIAAGPLVAAALASPTAGILMGLGRAAADLQGAVRSYYMTATRGLGSVPATLAHWLDQWLRGCGYAYEQFMQALRGGLAAAGSALGAGALILLAAAVYALTRHRRR